MTFLILICVVIVISGVLYLLDFSQTLYTINATTLEYSVSTVTVQNLFSFTGLKYIFSSTVANFVSFAPLSTLIIVLMGFGVMEKSGFLKTAITALTKKMKRNTVTFLLVFISIIASVLGDLSYIVLLPLSALWDNLDKLLDSKINQKNNQPIYFTVQNVMDSKVIGEATYKIVDNKFAMNARGDR